MNQHLNPGARVVIPTIEGDRRLPTYATYVGPDPDNDGYHLVYTDKPVMGEHTHSLPMEDIEATEAEPMVQRITRLIGGEWTNSGGGCMAIAVPRPDGSEIWITEREDVLWEGAWDSNDSVNGFYVSHIGPRNDLGDPAWSKDGIYVSPQPEWDEDRYVETGAGEVVDPLEADRVAEFVRNYIAAL